MKYIDVNKNVNLFISLLILSLICCTEKTEKDNIEKENDALNEMSGLKSDSEVQNTNKATSVQKEQLTGENTKHKIYEYYFSLDSISENLYSINPIYSRHFRKGNICATMIKGKLGDFKAQSLDTSAFIVIKDKLIKIKNLRRKTAIAFFIVNFEWDENILQNEDTLALICDTSKSNDQLSYSYSIHRKWIINE